jgi:steroid 5-alpha reductase family enzyme
VTAMRAAIIGLGTILAALTLVWMISVKRRDTSVADICWGLGFVLLAWLYCLLAPALTPQSWLVAALTTLWGTRLSVHIFLRHHGKAEDPRYQDPACFAGTGLLVAEPLHCLLAAGAILWFVALPLLVAIRASHAGELTAVDSVGIVLFVFGFSLEAVGDHQLERSRPSRVTAARCSTAGSGATRGIRTTSETPHCGGASMLSRHQRHEDGSPC